MWKKSLYWEKKRYISCLEKKGRRYISSSINNWGKSILDSQNHLKKY